MNRTNASPSGQDPLPKERVQFEADIQALLHTGNPDFDALMAYISRVLYQFHLMGQHDPEEVFHIAYNRGIQFTDSGTRIHNPLGWMRRTIFNIVRELSRQDKRVDSLDKEDVSEPSADEAPVVDTLIREEEVSLLYSALEQLNAVDRELLELRFLRGLSWLEVGQCLAIAHKGKHTEANLRQRGHRALKRLREIYLELSQE